MARCYVNSVVMLTRLLWLQVVVAQKLLAATASCVVTLLIVPAFPISHLNGACVRVWCTHTSNTHALPASCQRVMCVCGARCAC